MFSFLRISLQVKPPGQKRYGYMIFVPISILADLDNLPDPDILANEIIENVEAGLESFREIVETINGE